VPGDYRGEVVPENRLVAFLLLVPVQVSDNGHITEEALDFLQVPRWTFVSLTRPRILKVGGNLGWRPTSEVQLEGPPDLLNVNID